MGKTVIGDRNFANLVFWITKVAGGMVCPSVSELFVEGLKAGTAGKAKLMSSSLF